MKKVLSLLLIFLSVLVIVEYHVGRLTVGFDNGRQYVAARQFALGNGLVYPVFNESDLSSPHLEPRNEFPPGLSVFLSPLFLAFDDIRVIHTLFSLGNVALFLFLTYLLLTKLTAQNSFRRYVPFIFFFLAINGLFVHYTASTDLVCLNLVILGSLLLMRYFRRGRSTSDLALVAFTCVLCVYFRYAYFPALLVLPVFFAWRMVRHRVNEWKNLGYSMLFTFIFGFPLLGHVLYNSAQTGYITDKATDSGFNLYWENLVQINPFPMESFFTLVPVLKALGITSEHGYDRGYIYSDWIHFGFYVISIIILIPVFIYFRRFMKAHVIDSPMAITGRYLFIFSLGLVGLVLLGSLINPSVHEAYNWSWAKVFRYFLVPAFVIQLGYFVVLINERPGKLRYFVMLVLASSLLFKGAHKLYNYTANYTPFAFEHNTAIQAGKSSLLNSYNVHKALPCLRDEFQVILLDDRVQSHLSLEYTFFGLNNAAALAVDSQSSFAEIRSGFSTSKRVQAYFITSSEFEEASILSGSIKENLFAALDNGIEIYSFTLSPRGEMTR